MKRMILVDGNSLMYRAYYGMAANGSIQTNSKGVPTGAVYAFARMINHLIKSQYDAILVAFDKSKKTIRHEWMDSYKAGRPPMPDEFRMQIAYIKQFLDVMRIKQHEQLLYEADDIIGTMSKKAKEEGFHVDIYSSDKDLLQLIDENTTVHLTKKGMTELESYTPDFFFEKYEIKCEQFIDLKALMGDKSDNLPGIAGIGQKKAVKYLNQYDNLDGIIAHMNEIKGADGEKIRQNYETAILCRKMATIIRDFDIEITLEDTLKKDPDMDNLIKLYQELEFKSLLKDLTVSENKVKEIVNIDYKYIQNEEDLKDILLPYSSLIFETFEYNYHRCPILALGLKNKLGSFVINQGLLQSPLLKAFLEANNHKSIFDYKRAYVLCKRLGINLNGIDFDLLLATYILSPSTAKEEFKGIALYFEYEDTYYDEQVYGKGAKKALPDINIINDHVAKKVNALYFIKANALTKLKENNQLELLTEIEIPLSKVLGKMEFTGFTVDIDELENQKNSLEVAIKELESKIYSLANKEFNISSPKQLGTILFEDLGIVYPKKKGNSYSTDIEVLQSIRGENEIVDYIIDYRAKTKLYSTYVIGLKDLIYPDGKVHTIFEQALTQTGRLSSIEPNLQNIPIRTPEGHLIRKMFIPQNPLNSLYSADYSQIELRVLAHMAKVDKLIEAFNNGIDIHTKTAMEVFDKNIDEVTKEDRRRAKAVNFGIVYGISAFGLASDLGVSNQMASDFIKKYYEAYPEIKEYMDETIEFCKSFGYVKTMKNRIRHIPDINSKIYMQREFAKRMAMNAPIQGSAADIIKIAMIKVDEAIERENLDSHMLVQVHDELVFEVALGEEDKLQRIVKECLENAVKLSVPLEIDDSFGSNWYEVK